jgi:Na+(H+)/acetate symporter ActP
VTVWVPAMYGFDLSALMGDAVTRAGEAGEALLGPMGRYGTSELSKPDFISLSMALVLGTAGLPHVLMRFYTVPNAREARRSMTWAIGLIGLFYLFTLVPGLRSRRDRRPRDDQRPHLAFAVAASANLPVLLNFLFLEAVQHARRRLEHLRQPGHGDHPDRLLPRGLRKAGGPADRPEPSMLQGVDVSWFPLDNPGLVSIPAGFLLGYNGAVTSRELDKAKYAEMEVRSLTGAGSEKAVSH